MRATSPGSAPSDRRTPISPVRWLTTYDMTPIDPDDAEQERDA